MTVPEGDCSENLLAASTSLCWYETFISFSGGYCTIFTRTPLVSCHVKSPFCRAQFFFGPILIPKKANACWRMLLTFSKFKEKARLLHIKTCKKTRLLKKRALFVASFCRSEFPENMKSIMHQNLVKNQPNAFKNFVNLGYSKHGLKMCF